MGSDKELFDLARNYAHLESRFGLAATEEDIEDIKEEMEYILTALLKGGYDANKFVQYKNMYKEMSIGDYLEFIKTFE